jgi:hypothetical protein
MQSTSLVMAGIGLAVVGYAGRFILRKAPNITEQMTKAAEMLPKLDAQVCIWYILVFALFTYLLLCISVIGQ